MEVQPRRSTHFGIDLGTGATCIYPLLCCASQVEIEDHNIAGSSWKWLASEVDPISCSMAFENVKANGSESRIQVVQVQPTSTQQKQIGTTAHDDSDSMVEDATTFTIQKGPLRCILEALPKQSQPQGMVDVIMTNPPFHEPDATLENQPVRAGDQRAKTTITQSEGCYPGGEVQFLVDTLVDAIQLTKHPTLQVMPRATVLPTKIQPNLTARWYASMFGKKTSWTQVSRILAYMLGPARIQATEFGPGNLTRWFLAWTFARPNPRSPLAIYHSKHQSNTTSKEPMLSFQVTLEDVTERAQGVIQGVVDRVMSCFTSFPGFEFIATRVGEQGNGTTASMGVNIQEKTPTVEEWDSGLLPRAILEALQYRGISFMHFLPSEGHFLVDVTVSASSNDTTATVQLHGYAHSHFGRKVLDKIAAHAQADICRTSRRWRRIVKRQMEGRLQYEQYQPMGT